MTMQRHIALANRIIANAQATINQHDQSRQASGHAQLRRARARLQLAVRILTAARRQTTRTSTQGQYLLSLIQQAQKLSAQAKGWSGFSTHWNCPCGSCNYSSWQ